MPQHDVPVAPERRCILTGDRGSRGDLIRLALGPDGDVLPDLGARAPGRGAWVSPDRALVDGAAAKGKLRGALARAFKSNELKLPDDMGALIEAGLKRRAMERLGLELKAGNLILGSDRIIDSVKSGKVHLLLHASDASPDGAAKIDQKLRVAETGRSLTVPATREEISMALGKENVVHAALVERGAAERVAAAVERWRAFNGMTSTKKDAASAASAA